MFNNSGNSVLIDFIRSAIRQTGSVSFEWFMEQALYHPEWGYYSSGRCAIGRDGDFFTNVSVGSLFGELLAAQFTEIWERVGKPDDFVIVEQGAHHGDFARDVLEALHGRAPELFRTVHYWIIEPFPILQTRQSSTLNDFIDKVTWQRSLSELPQFCGVHFSNELLDSMPVRLIAKTAESGSWFERSVVESNEHFTFATAPSKDVDLAEQIKHIPSLLNAPYETEVALSVLRWIENLSSKLVRGYALTIDYGYARSAFYAPDRNAGTLRCRSKHQIVPSPFIGVGETDITTHIDWTTLAERAEATGFSLGGFTDQHHFITGIVAELMATEFSSDAAFTNRRALQTLLHPELLGTSFQVLCLAKGIPNDSSLSGFRFARDSRVALEL